MIIEGAPLQKAGESFGQSSILMRLSNAIGVSKIIILETCVALDTSGGFTVLQDHCSFAGCNPLRGKNIDSQGVRFFD